MSWSDKELRKPCQNFLMSSNLLSIDRSKCGMEGLQSILLTIFKNYMMKFLPGIAQAKERECVWEFSSLHFIAPIKWEGSFEWILSGCAAASYRKLNLYSTPRFEKSSLEHYLLSIRYVCRLNVSSLGSKGGTCSTHSTLQRSSNGILNTSAILSHELRARHTIIAGYVFYHAVSLAFQPETSVSDHQRPISQQRWEWASCMKQLRIGVLFSSLGKAFLWWAIRTCEGGVSFFSVSVLTCDFRDLPNVIGPNICKFSIFKGRVLFCISNS